MNFRDFIYLTKEKFNTLASGGSITKGGETFTYDDSQDVYAVEATIVEDVVDTEGTSLVDSDGIAHIPEGGLVDDVQVNGTSVVTNKVASVAVPTNTSDLTNDSGFIVNASIIITPAMIISQDPLTIQLTAEQDAIITDEANDFIRLDATQLGIGSNIFTKSKSNISGDYILTNAICNYNSTSLLPTNPTTETVIYRHSTMVGVYSEIATITMDAAERVINKVTSISSSSTDTQYPSAKAAYDILSHIPYLTTAPTADNTSGLQIVILSSEPATKYNGYLYFIEEE